MLLASPAEAGVMGGDERLAKLGLAGADFALRDVPGAAWKDYLRERAAEVAPLFERSGVSSWPEFCVRFAHGFDTVCATVGSTSKPERLSELVAVSRGSLSPLDTAITSEIAKLQRRWSEEVDVLGTPDSM